jgi:hypothetical protein
VTPGCKYCSKLVLSRTRARRSSIPCHDAMFAMSKRKSEAIAWVLSLQKISQHDWCWKYPKANRSCEFHVYIPSTDPRWSKMLTSPMSWAFCLMSDILAFWVSMPRIFRSRKSQMLSLTTETSLGVPNCRKPTTQINLDWLRLSQIKSALRSPVRLWYDMISVARCLLSSFLASWKATSSCSLCCCLATWTGHIGGYVDRSSQKAPKGACSACCIFIPQEHHTISHIHNPTPNLLPVAQHISGSAKTSAKTSWGQLEIVVPSLCRPQLRSSVAANPPPSLEGLRSLLRPL